MFRFVIVAVALAACGGAPDSAPRLEPAVRTADAEAAATGRVAFVGTSLTAGYGLDADVAYPAVVGRWMDSLNLSYEAINAGVSGETSAGTRRRIGWLLDQPVDVIVLETGANDGLRGLSVDSLRANLHAILDSIEARRPGTEVFLAGMEAPPNLGSDYTRRFRETFPSVARERGARFIPFLLEGVAGVDTLNLPDGIHPNERGARIVAANVWRELEGVVKR
jgi:acyl-CoA thioesterase I